MTNIIKNEVIANAKILYALPAKTTEYNYTEFLDPNFDASVSFGGIEIFSPDFPNSIPNLEFRILDNINTDEFSSKYFGRLVTVWFEAMPIAIIQHNGKWGRGFNKIFITNQYEYGKMVMSIFNSVIMKNLQNLKDSIVIKEYDPRKDLTNFDNLEFNLITRKLEKKY